jgi:glycosyltransferase involved in cell wall biosynthesis
MRILRVADVPDVRTSGMQRAMYGTGDVLRAQGHTVDYLFREGIDAPGPEKLRRFTVPFRIPAIVRAFARRGKTYDVVEIHEPLAGAYCLLQKVMSDLPPVVAYSHGLEERMHQARLAYHRRKGMPVSLKTRLSPLSVVLQAKYAVRRARHVMCTNEQDLEHLRAAGVAAVRLTKVPSGVSAEFLAAEPPRARDPASILFVGTWIPRKGILDLVPAATTVLRRHAGARVTVAGSGGREVDVRAAFPGDIQDRLTVIPHLADNRQLIECYRRHAVFVLPSYFEGYPIAMVEAAALGLALVTTDVCGMDEFVESGQNGIKVRVGDPDALAEALLRLVRDEAEAHRLGALARRKAARFSWNESASLVARAYERALGTEPPGPVGRVVTMPAGVGSSRARSLET